MLVKPRKGLKILRPDTSTVLAESGEVVPKTGFWLRRLKQGDVTLVETAKKESVQVEDKPKKEKVKKLNSEVK